MKLVTTISHGEEKVQRKSSNTLLIGIGIAKHDNVNGFNNEFDDTLLLQPSDEFAPEH